MEPFDPQCTVPGCAIYAPPQNKFHNLRLHFVAIIQEYVLSGNSGERQTNKKSWSLPNRVGEWVCTTCSSCQRALFTWIVKTRFSGRIQEVAGLLISIRVIPDTDALVYHIANNRELHAQQCGVSHWKRNWKSLFETAKAISKVTYWPLVANQKCSQDKAPWHCSSRFVLVLVFYPTMLPRIARLFLWFRVCFSGGDSVEHKQPHLSQRGLKAAPNVSG